MFETIIAVLKSSLMPPLLSILNFVSTFIKDLFSDPNKKTKKSVVNVSTIVILTIFILLMLDSGGRKYNISGEYLTEKPQVYSGVPIAENEIIGDYRAFIKNEWGDREYCLLSIHRISTYSHSSIIECNFAGLNKISSVNCSLDLENSALFIPGVGKGIFIKSDDSPLTFKLTLRRNNEEIQFEKIEY